ncbi:hypothetical protein SLE2022_072860 [Rubroshorea leprosula]
MADTGMEQTENGIGMKKMNLDFETFSLKKTEAETEEGKCSNPICGVELSAAEEDAAVFFLFVFLIAFSVGGVRVTCRNGGRTRRL